MTHTYPVTGMTCDNCVRHVRAALLDVPGVRSAAVDLAQGRATLEADPLPAREAIAAALREAGYELG